MKNIIKIIEGLSPSDINRISLLPFWFCIVGLLQLFHPFFEDGTKIYFFIVLSGSVLSYLTNWIIDLVIALIGHPETVSLPNFPYDLFYHYKLKETERDGFIYLAKRLKDGIYKVGRANDLNRRIRTLQREYGPMAMIAVWEVLNCGECEKVALDRTKEFTYREPGRQELRLMDDWQCWQFINDFSKYVIALDTSKNPDEFIEQV